MSGYVRTSQGFQIHLGSQGVNDLIKQSGRDFGASVSKLFPRLSGNVVGSQSLSFIHLFGSNLDLCGADLRYLPRDEGGACDQWVREFLVAHRVFPALQNDRGITEDFVVGVFDVHYLTDVQC